MATQPNLGYQGSPLLKKAGVQVNFTKEQYDEYVKCAQDPEYFIEGYLKGIDADKGLVPIKLRDYQRRMVRSFHGNRRTIVCTARRAGKSTAVGGYLLWYVLFNKEKTVAMLANKGETARELLGGIQIAYKSLPLWMQQGITEFNKGSFVLENGSRILAAATASDAIRGYTISILAIDECAFVTGWNEFSASVLPTITSGKETKLIMVSTPNGLNHFYDIWKGATEGKNGYHPIMVKWQDVPGNDEKWYQETMEMLNHDVYKFNQEYNTDFIGSSNTLIRGDKLDQIQRLEQQPIEYGDHLKIYALPMKNHTYCMTVDVSEGLNLDYSTFSIFDVTSVPYRQVATYRNNAIEPFMFPTIIYTEAVKYNDAFVLVEINSIGLQVADILHFELGYENLIKIQVKGKQGQQFGPGMTKKVAYGIKTSPQTKRIGCTNLKALIENDKLIVVDKESLLELRTFSMNKNTFKAEEGKNDDMAMTLVHFGWLTGQKYFKENINSNIRQILQEEQKGLMDEILLPIGIRNDGINDPFADQEEKSWLKDGGYLPDLEENFGDPSWGWSFSKTRL